MPLSINEQRRIEEEFDKKVDDFAMNIYYEGDPKRTLGTTQKDLTSFLISTINQVLEEKAKEVERLTVTEIEIDDVTYADMISKDLVLGILKGDTDLTTKE